MYMDDVKLVDKNEKELETEILTIRIYSQCVGMRFGREECSISSNENTEGIKLPKQNKIRTLGEKETYKYLGVL